MDVPRWTLSWIIPAVWPTVPSRDARRRRGEAAVVIDEFADATRQWQEDGFALVPGLVPAAEIDAVTGDLAHLYGSATFDDYNRAQGFGDVAAAGRRFHSTQFDGMRGFPMRGCGALDDLFVHPASSPSRGAPWPTTTCASTKRRSGRSGPARSTRRQGNSSVFADFVRSKSPDDLALFGIPRRGHAFWNAATVWRWPRSIPASTSRRGSARWPSAGLEWA